ncbi:PilW family protein [Pseudoalteromonas sp. MTN2-4]|uniref:PilW family protein n=1 Tax=Pseudoalteromonas sp. MTN2-4 TaxID=3056555 RepID=UPI0036F239A4
MAVHPKFSQTGYTLLEMLVAMAVGLFLLAGVAMSYSAIKSTVRMTQELSDAQEVIRYTSQVFTRSVKQTNNEPIISAAPLTIQFQQLANVLSCQGTTPAVDYTETYALENGFLTCDIGDGNGAVQLLKGIEAINFAYNNHLVSVTVKPINIPSHFGVGLQIDIATTQLILLEAFKESVL